MAAGDTKHTVDADHPTQTLTLTLTRAKWVDLCLDAKKGIAGCWYGEVIITLVLFRPV